MKKSFSQLSAVALVGILASAGTAYAQGEDYFVRDKYQAVTERSQPEYDPIRLQANGFEISPEVAFRTGFTDNLFATNTNEIDDIFVGIIPSINFNSTWSRHSLSFGGTVDHIEYNDVDSESRTNINLRANAGLDVSSQFNIFGGVIFDDLTEPRSNIASLQNALEPVEYTRTGAELGASYEAGRLRVNGGVGFVTADFDDVELDSGLIQDQDFRDSDDVFTNLRVAFAVERDWAVFAELNHNETSFDQPNVFNTTIRDFTDTSLRGGVNFELQSLIRGDIGIGYFQSEFDEPTFSDVDGLSVDANLQWFVTQLTTINFAAGREIIDPGLVQTSGAVRTNASVRADHELRRNILVSGEVRYTQFEFENFARSDDRWNFRASTTWKVNRNLWVDGSYELTDQTSDVQDFSENRFLVGLRIFP